MPARGAATRRSASTPEPTAEPLDHAAMVSAHLKIDLRSDEFRAQHLVTKLATIMDMVGYVPKRGFNDFHRYNYVMEADLVATIRPLLDRKSVV